MLLPIYQEMIQLFRRELWLAEPDTVAHLGALVEFVEVWERIKDDSLPSPVALGIGHEEENLHALYDHLESRVTELRRRLKEGKV